MVRLQPSCCTSTSMYRVSSKPKFLPPMATKKVPGSKRIRLQVQRCLSEPHIGAKGIVFHKDKVRPRKPGAASKTNEDDSPSMSSISRIAVSKTRVKDVKEISNNLEALVSALQHRLRVLLGSIGNAGGLAKLDRFLQTTEIMMALQEDQRSLSALASDLSNRAESFQLKTEEAERHLHLLKSKLDSIGINTWTDTAVLTRSVDAIENDILGVEHDRVLTDLPSSVSQCTQDRKLQLLMMRVLRLEELVLVQKKRLAMFEHNVALGRALEKHSSLPNLLRHMSHLENENMKLRRRELRFQHDPLMRRRNLRQCSPLMSACLILALQNELAVYREIWHHVEHNIDHPLAEIAKPIIKKAAPIGSNTLDIDSAYRLLIKTPTETNVGSEAEQPSEKAEQPSEKKTPTVVENEELLRTLLQPSLRRESSTGKSSSEIIEASETTHQQQEVKEQSLVKSALFQLQQMRKRIHNEYSSPEEQHTFGGQECLDRWLVKRMVDMPIEEKMLAVDTLAAKVERAIEIIRDDKQVQDLTTLVQTLSSQLKSASHKVVKASSLLSAIARNQKRDNMAAKDEDYQREDEGKSSGEVVEFQEQERSPFAFLHETGDLTICPFTARPQASGISLKLDSDIRKALRSHRRFFEKVCSHLLKAADNHITVDRFVDFCRMTEVMPSKIPEQGVRDIFRLSCSEEGSDSLTFAQLEEAVARMGLIVHGDTAGNLAYPKKKQKVNALLTDMEISMQTLVSKRRRPSSRASSRNSRASVQSHTSRGLASAVSNSTIGTIKSARPNRSRSMLARDASLTSLASKHGGSRRHSRTKSTGVSASVIAQTMPNTSSPSASKAGSISARRTSTAHRRTHKAAALLASLHLHAEIVSKALLKRTEHIDGAMRKIFTFFGSPTGSFDSDEPTSLANTIKTSVQDEVGFGLWETHQFAKRFKLVPFMMSKMELDQCFTSATAVGSVANNGTEDMLSTLVVAEMSNQRRLSYPEFKNLLCRLAVLVFSRSPTSSAAIEMRTMSALPAIKIVIEQNAIQYLIDFLDVESVSSLELKQRLERTRI